jgi:hypothetical protein
MSDRDNFLLRWSRRKRGASPATRGQAKAELRHGAAMPDPTAASSPAEARPSFDAASLPPIESIGAGSDIQAFLAAGVPTELTRAALRRAWSMDPAIRDFIGLSENSWDFNAVGGVPGFGSVTAEDVRRLLAQAIGAPDVADPSQPSTSIPVTEQTLASATAPARTYDAAPAQPIPEGNDGAAAAADIRNEKNAAVQRETKREGDRSALPRPALPRRSHGGALPE